jgi:tRNA(Arg) A34 adenosine deaminase TadA
MSMHIALEEARRAAARQEVPVGAVVVAPDGRIVSQAGNRTEALNDASAHAELLAMREAARSLRSPRLAGCDLFVTLEPCPMCAAAAVHFRIRRVIFGAYDIKGGGIEHGPRIFQAPGCLHVPEVIGGVQETEAAALLKSFFAARR